MLIAHGAGVFHEHAQDRDLSLPVVWGFDSPRGRGNVGELPSLIAFNWGSCAWRHCGAKADAQEAVAKLYSNLGMLGPFECRFIISKQQQ